MPGIVQCVLQVLIDSILTATLDEVGTIISPFSQLRRRSEAACLREQLLLGKAWEGCSTCALKGCTGQNQIDTGSGLLKLRLFAFYP